MGRNVFIMFYWWELLRPFELFAFCLFSEFVRHITNGKTNLLVNSNNQLFKSGVKNGHHVR